MATQTRFTRADLERIPEDAYGRHEIIDGRLVVSPSPTIPHAKVVMNVVLALAAWARPRGGLVLAGNVDLYVAEDQNVIPDALLILAEHLDRVEERFLRQPPDLVVEVASPSNRRRDLGAKRRIYAGFGVPEYWFADRDAGRIDSFRLADGGYPEPIRFDVGDVLETPLLPDFTALVAELLGP